MEIPARRSARAATALFALAAACIACAAVESNAGPPPGPPWRIVVLHGTDGQLPAGVLADTAFRAAVGAVGTTRVEIFTDYLDTIRFPKQQLEDELLALLKKKHSERLPHLVVAFSNNALEFAERHHEALWPDATLMFMGVNELDLPRARGPHAATGVVLRRQNAETVELGLRLLPKTRRLVLVGGASEWDRGTMALAKADVDRFASRVEIEYLENLPFAELVERAAKLPEGTLLFPISLFRDSLGQSFIPSEAIGKIQDGASIPSLAVVGTRMGRGVLGGHILSYSDQGREAGAMALEILGGRDARAMPVRAPASGCQIDWRELRRWSIPMDRVPGDCEVRFREYTYWEQHRTVILGATAIILLQALLITGLILQHRQRRRAERAAQLQHTQLAHAARLATVGELTASIAHEINQPLGAILSNADAAEILLESPQPDLTEIRQILADIRRDDVRASEVIKRLRALLVRQEIDRQDLDPNSVVNEAMMLITPEADRRGTRLVKDLAPSLPAVNGDRVHLVQVMIVLLINAIDAMDEEAPAKRRVVVSTAMADSQVEFTVRDAGPGIPVANLGRLFDSFFTTREKGMGMGLSIARSIVEAHGGRIWAENFAGGGAVFRFQLAVAR